MPQDPFKILSYQPVADDTDEQPFKILGYEPEPPQRSMLSRLGGRAMDVGVTTAKGIQAIPEFAIGLADIPTLGRAGKLLKPYYDPVADRATMDALYSPEQKAAFDAFQNAEGFGGKLKAAIDNPSTIFHTVLESAPSMLAGGYIGRGVAMVAPRVAAIAGAIGEGTVAAGSAAESTRQQTADGTLTPTQAGLAVATGAGTGVFGVLGQKLSKALDIADIDSLLAGTTTETAKRGLVRKVIYGASSEALEELPQSVQEQILANKALGKPWDEGVDQAAVMGTLAGAAMGAGAQFVPRGKPPITQPPPPPAPPPTAAPPVAAAPLVTPPARPTGVPPRAPVSPQEPIAGPMPQAPIITGAPPVTAPLPPPIPVGSGANQEEIDAEIIRRMEEADAREGLINAQPQIRVEPKPLQAPRPIAQLQAVVTGDVSEDEALMLRSMAEELRNLPGEAGYLIEADPTLDYEAIMRQKYDAQGGSRYENNPNVIGSVPNSAGTELLKLLHARGATGNYRAIADQIMGYLDGKKPHANTKPETMAAVKVMAQQWVEGWDPATLSWNEDVPRASSSSPLWGIQPEDNARLKQLYVAPDPVSRIPYINTPERRERRAAARTDVAEAEAIRAARAGTLGGDVGFDPSEFGADPPSIGTDVNQFGEAQPRLPEAGGVRDQNVPTPQVAEEPGFSLTNELDRPTVLQGSMFGQDAPKTGLTGKPPIKGVSSDEVDRLLDQRYTETEASFGGDQAAITRYRDQADAIGAALIKGDAEQFSEVELRIIANTVGLEAETLRSQTGADSYLAALMLDKSSSRSADRIALFTAVFDIARTRAGRETDTNELDRPTVLQGSMFGEDAPKEGLTGKPPITSALEKEEFTDEQVMAVERAYSADKIAEGKPVRTTTLGNRLVTSTGSGDRDGVNAYFLVPESEMASKYPDVRVHNYNDEDGGFSYLGMRVKVGKQPMVMAEELRVPYAKIEPTAPEKMAAMTSAGRAARGQELLELWRSNKDSQGNKKPGGWISSREGRTVSEEMNALVDYDAEIAETNDWPVVRQRARFPYLLDGKLRYGSVVSLGTDNDTVQATTWSEDAGQPWLHSQNADDNTGIKSIPIQAIRDGMEEEQRRDEEAENNTNTGTPQITKAGARAKVSKPPIRTKREIAGGYNGPLNYGMSAKPTVEKKGKTPSETAPVKVGQESTSNNRVTIRLEHNGRTLQVIGQPVYDDDVIRAEIDGAKRTPKATDQTWQIVRRNFVGGQGAQETVVLTDQLTKPDALLQAKRRLVRTLSDEAVRALIVEGKSVGNLSVETIGVGLEDELRAAGYERLRGETSWGLLLPLDDSPVTDMADGVIRNEIARLQPLHQTRLEAAIRRGLKTADEARDLKDLEAQQLVALGDRLKALADELRARKQRQTSGKPPTRTRAQIFQDAEALGRRPQTTLLDDPGAEAIALRAKMAEGDWLDSRNVKHAGIERELSNAGWDISPNGWYWKPKSADDDAPMFAAREEEIELEFDKKRMMQLLGPRMYEKPIQEVATKELLQNSFDAVRQAGATEKNPGHIDITVDNAERTMTVTDDGIGMTPTIIKKAFFTIGGTHKEGKPENTSGGLGLAKMAFILGSQKIRVETTRDGVTSTVEATSEQIQDQKFTISSEDTGRPSGTTVTVWIPKSYRDSNDEVRGIWMQSAPDFLSNPLIGPVVVTLNGEELPIGVNMPSVWQRENEFRFSWGTIHLYINPTKKEYPTIRVLSAGLHQFEVGSYTVFGNDGADALPYDMVLDVRPKVRPENAAYPFNNQREDFRPTIREDVTAMYAFMRRMAVEQQILDAKDTFKELKQLPKFSIKKEWTEADQRAYDQRIAQFRSENQGRIKAKSKVTNVTITDDEVIVTFANRKKETTPKEKYVEKSFDPVKQVSDEAITLDVGGLDPSAPQLHNNTTETFDAPQERQLFAEVGNALLAFMREWGRRTEGTPYAALADASISGWFGGVSLDKEYRGLNMIKPMRAIWFNPLYISSVGMASPEAAASEALHIFIHEITHVAARNEGAAFTAELANNYARIRAAGIPVEVFENALQQTFERHWETLKDANERFTNFNTKNRGSSFKSAASIGPGQPRQTGSAPSRASDVDAAGDERVQEEGRGRTGRAGETDRGAIGDILDSKLSARDVTGKPPVSRKSEGKAKGQPFLARLEAMSDDDAMGVTYDDEGLSTFPDGSYAVVCTNCAEQIINKVGRGEVFGWADGTNPTSVVAGPSNSAQADEGQGHDFAVIDDRYLVDPWARNVEQSSERAAFDLEDAKDRREVLRLYGDPKTWMRRTPDGFVPDMPTPLRSRRAAAKAKRQEAGARVRIALRKQLFNLNSGLGFDDELFSSTRSWVRVAIEQGAVNAQELWAEFLAGMGERAWLAHRTFQLAWKRYSGKDANIPYEGPAEFAPQNVPETAKPVRTFSEEDRTLLSGFGLQALVYPDGSVALTGKLYENRGTLKPFGTYDGGSWLVQAGSVEGLIAQFRRLPVVVNGRRRAVAPHLRDPRLRGLREAAERRPDLSGLAAPAESYLGPDIPRVLRRGRGNVPDDVIEEQIEDVARIKIAHDRGSPLFMLASEPGTGKTYVLGGAMRELFDAGAERVTYVTLRTELIDQIKQNLAGFKLGDRVNYVTYTALRTMPPQATDALIFDEAHLIKNTVEDAEGKLTIAQADAARQWMKAAKFTIFASATPFENATEMKYLEPTDIFKDVFGTFRDFALAFGATSANENAVAWARTATTDEDAAAARDWMIREGIYTSRRIRLPIEQIDSRLVRVKADQKIADLYEKLEEAIAEAEADPKVKLGGLSKAWLQNFKKRLLEASKVDIGIKEAKSAIARGRYPIVFVETKAERNINIKQLVQDEEEWKRDAAIARRSHEPPPIRKAYGLPPKGITEILASVAAKTGENQIDIPSALSQFREAFGRDQVAIFTGTAKAGTDYGVSKEESARNLQDWREGKRKLLVATMAKGGTGLSLHDTVGNHPTTQININLPWVATQVVQVAQRSARYGLKGRAEIAWLFAENIPFDRELSRKIGGRMADLGSLVHGEKLKGSDALRSWNFEDPSFSEAEEDDTEDDDTEDDDTLSDVLSDDDDVRDPLEGRKARAGTPIDAYPEGVEPIELPEALEIIEELLGQVPKVARRMSAEKRGQFNPSNGLISLNPALFKKGQEQQLAKTLLHEFGHAVDWLDDQNLKRGNLLGRLKSLSAFLKHTFTNPDGTTIKLAEVKQELTALSDAWRKWDKSKSSDAHKKYRASSVELFADALSALFNDPGYVAEVAPVFYGEFLRSLDRKPDVKTAFDNIQSVIRRGRDDRETLINRRIDRDIADFKRGSEKALEIERERQTATQDSRKNIWERLKLQHLDKHYWAVDRKKDLKRRGVEVNEYDDPFTALGERNYMGGQQKGWTDRNIGALLDQLTKAGITWDEFGVFLKADRIVSGDRGNAVNAADDADDVDDVDDVDDMDDADDVDDADEPIGQQIPNRGGTPKDAEELLAQHRKRLGPTKVKALDRAVEVFRSIISEMVNDGYQAGLYRPETFERMKRNPAYATNRVIDYMTDKISFRIYQQRGSLKAIDNPASATTLKMLSTLRMIEHQKVKAIVFRFLERHFPDEIQQATVTRGKDGKRTVQPPKDRLKWELVLYMRLGRLEGMYVSPTIADSINNASIGHTLATAMILRRLNSGWFRPVFTTMNLGFQTVNIVRDMLRYWKNMPDTSLAKMLANYWRAMPLAKVRAFGLSDPEVKGIQAEMGRLAMRLVGITRAKELQGAEDLLQAEETKQLSITFNDLMKGRHIEDTQIEDILSRTSVRVGAPPISLGRKLVTLKPLTDFIKNMGDFIETLPKAAAMHELKGKGQVRDIGPANRSLIRRKIGSPDYLAGGTAKPIFNELFLFSNAIIQAWRSDIEVATDLRKNPTTGIYESPSGFWWKTAAINVLPKFLMMAALSGMLDRWWWGEEYGRMLEKISEYDKTNYLVIPIRQNAKGEVTYLRIPTDDTGRFVGGLWWKALRLARGDKGVLETTAQVLSYTLGNMPTPAPGIKLVGEAAQMLAGQNPYDSFRGRNIFTNDQWQAKDAFMMERLGEHLFQELGGSVVSNPLNRWVRTSSYGETEGLREAGDVIKRVEAQRRNQVTEELQPRIEQYSNMPESDRTLGVAFGMAREIVEKVYADRPLEERKSRTNDVRGKIMMGAVRKTADPLTEQLSYTQTNAEKRAIIAKGRKSMTSAQFEQWLISATQNAVISRDLAAEIRRQLRN